MAKDPAAFLDAFERKERGGGDAASFLDKWEKREKAKPSPQREAAAFLDRQEKRGGKSIFERFRSPQQDTPAEARQRVLRAKGEDRQRRTREAVERKYPTPKKQQDFVNLSSPASQVKKDPSLAKGGVVRQVIAGVKAGSEAAGGGAQGLINFVGTPFYPAQDFLNKLADERGKLGAKYKGKPIPLGEQHAMVVRAWQRARPAAALKKGLRGESVDPQMIANWAKNDPAMKKALKRIGVSPQVMDILVSIPVEAALGKAQAKLVGGAQKLVTGRRVTPLPGKALSFKGVDVQAAAEKKVPALGRTLASRRAYRTSGEAFNLKEAQQGAVLREVAEAAKDLKATSRKYRKQAVVTVQTPSGATKVTKKAPAAIRQKDPLTGRTVNKLDQLVADWMEAGAEGSRHGLPASTPITQEAARARELGEVAKDAAAHGIDFADVERLGTRYKAITDQLGQGMVDAGLMTQEVFDRLRGVYLPRLYALRASKPKEAKRYLAALEKQGHLDADTAKALERQINQRAKGLSGSPTDFTKQRQDFEDFAGRVDPKVGRLAEGSATPALTRYAKSATEEIADAQARREIVKNPTLALPKEQAPRHWIDELEVDGVTYNIDPGVKRYMDVRANGEVVNTLIRRFSPEAAEGWRKLNQWMRKAWMSAPPSAINNAAGNYQLGASAAALNGARYHLPGYVSAAREWKRFNKTGQAPPVLKEALEQTDLLAEGGSVLPRTAGEVGSGFGVETLGQRVRQGVSEGFEAYSDALLRDPEKAARYYLYKELREAGKSVDEAARITRAAMIDYSDVGWFKKMLDQNNILPFLTFPTKAIFQYINLAVRRPDLFETWTGERLRDLMDTLSDESAERQGRPATARDRRARGDVGITSFPIPGQFDSRGQPLYMRSNAMAPIAMMAPFGRPDQPMDPLQFIEERGRSAFPLARVPLEMLGNFSTFRKFKPIVEPGSVPGTLGSRDAWANPEALTAFGLHLGKSFAPQVGHLERLYHAITGTTTYPGMFAPKQTVGQALIQMFTGAAIQEGAADRGEEGLRRAGERAKEDRHQPFKDFSTRYIREIESGKVARNPDYVRKAGEIQTRQSAMKHLEAATNKAKAILSSDFYTGEDRYKQIRLHLDWIYALADRAKELAALEGAGAPPE